MPRAKKVTIDGYTFGSILESKRYKALRLFELAGDIASLDAYKPNLRFVTEIGVRLPENHARRATRKIRNLYYECDFRYDIEICGIVYHVWEDVKSTRKVKSKKHPEGKIVPYMTPKARYKINTFKIRNPSIVLRICIDVEADPLNKELYYD